MASTLIIQSYSTPVEPAWLDLCLETAKAWSESYRLEYRFLDDCLFD